MFLGRKTRPEESVVAFQRHLVGSDLERHADIFVLGISLKAPGKQHQRIIIYLQFIFFSCIPSHPLFWPSRSASLYNIAYEALG